MSLKLISKHRTALMAIAMLWIGLYHSYFPYNSKFLVFMIDKNGHGGIDIFLFLSSLGLYFAYKKDSNYLSFIKRRFLRILPYALPFFLILKFAGYLTWMETLIDCLGLSVFFRDNLVNWYTSLILVLYVFTPLYLKIFRKQPELTTVAGIAVFLVICLVNGTYDFVYVWFRVAVFNLGFYFAYLLDRKGDISNVSKIVLIILMIAGWFLMYYMYHHFGNDHVHVYPFILIIPGLLLILSYVVEKIKFIQKPLNSIGMYTYQFYLIHYYVISIFYKYYEVLYRPGIYFDWLINLAAFIVAYILSVIYKKAIDFCADCFRKSS